MGYDGWAPLLPPLQWLWLRSCDGVRWVMWLNHLTSWDDSYTGILGQNWATIIDNSEGDRCLFLQCSWSRTQKPVSMTWCHVLIGVDNCCAYFNHSSFGVCIPFIRCQDPLFKGVVSRNLWIWYIFLLTHCMKDDPVDEGVYQLSSHVVRQPFTGLFSVLLKRNNLVWIRIRERTFCLLCPGSKSLL